MRKLKLKLKLQVSALATMVLLSGLAFGAADGRKTYLVQLKGEPAATYQGGVQGLAATQPAPGATFTFGSAAVQAYIGYLGQQQTTVAASVGMAPVLARYNTVFNGFSARLTNVEVIALKSNANVVEVFEDLPLQLQTISTPKFLGLTATGGVWSQMVGGIAVKGENMVVGVIDTGIWPESPAFADRVDNNGVPNFSGTQVYGVPPVTFSGGCVGGEGFSPTLHCNNKLVGAKFFDAGFNASGLTKHWSEFNSPRDSIGGAANHGGHGDHTASTAAGNNGATAVVAGTALGVASGVAPRARVAAYKVCWTFVNPTATDGTGSQNTCYTSDSVSAIDAAVRDGVNAINYSISGSLTSVNDPVEQAFYRASLAGVFIAASAGNSGPANQVAHISPWITTVAASTHDRAFQSTVRLGNSLQYTGASINTHALPATQLIRAEDAGLPGANTTNLQLCFSSPAVLDPAKVVGKVVICTRGTNARVDKSLAVAQAGGAGMILMDNGAGLVAEAHSVPSVHVSSADGATIKAYAVSMGAGATAALGVFFYGTVQAPVMAGFSSRGPNLGDSNILKPDITAPGVDVIASVSPDLTQAQRNQVASGTLVPSPDWASYQGTSMSSPHIAGLSLLLKQAYPGWSPAAIKSAMMTTAYPTLNDGLAGAQNGLLPWAKGAGHVNINRAIDPGLVYDAGKADFAAYQCNVNKAAMPAADCITYGTLDDTYNLNLPSITVGNVPGSVTVRRKVTNVGPAAATYASGITVPGFTAVVTPTTLTLNPGETKSFTVSLTVAGAVENVWAFGAMAWSDGVHTVLSPVQVRAGKAIGAPLALTGNTASGTRLFTVKTGFAGRMTAAKGGLKDVTLSAPFSLSPNNDIDLAQLKAVCAASADTANVKVFNFAIPADTVVARFALRDQDVGTPGDDFDLMILYPDGTTNFYSGNNGSNEAVQVASPPAGAYKVCVTSYATVAGGSSTFKLSSWVVNRADVGGKLTVLVPGTVYAGGAATVGVSWSGLLLGGRYMGAAQWLDLSGVVQATTVLRIETNGGLPVTEAQDSSPNKVTTMN